MDEVKDQWDDFSQCKRKKYVCNYSTDPHYNLEPKEKDDEIYPPDIKQAENCFDECDD